MRIVIGARAIAVAGGTETYIATVSRELERLGHDVTIATEDAGPMAEVLRREGLRLLDRREDLPSRCDAVLANDATITSVLAERYPDTRLVYVAHSDRSDHQLPVLIPGVVDSVVACSDRFAARIRALALDVPIVRLRQPIDTDRFLSTRSLPVRPRRALILSNYLDGDRARALVSTWESHGVECVRIGLPAEGTFDPRPAMEEADIVVGKARVALEAMCSGRAVYLYDQFGGDGWVTPDSYAALEADHFAGQATPAPRGPEHLADDLGRYHPDMGWMNLELVRTHHGARHHAMELVAVLRGDHVRPPDATTALAEISRLTRANWRAEGRVIGLEQSGTALRTRAVEAESQARDWQARALRAERQLGTRRAQAGIALGRAIDRMRGRP